MPNGYFNIDFLSTTESHYTIGPGIREVRTRYISLLTFMSEIQVLEVTKPRTAFPVFF